MSRISLAIVAVFVLQLARPAFGSEQQTYEFKQNYVAGHAHVLGSDQSIVAFGTLKSIKTIHGRQFAEVIVSEAIEGSFRRQSGLHMESQMEGPALIDLQSGRIAKMDLVGQVQCTGTVDVAMKTGGTVPLNANGGGTIEYHQISIAAKPQPVKTDTANANFRELP